MSADHWIEAAAPNVSGCPLVTLRAEWLNTAREFFTRSTCWRMDLDEVQILVGQRDYPAVSPVADSVVNLIHQVTIPNRFLTPLNQSPKVLADQESESPTGFYTNVPDIVSLYPLPTKVIDGMVFRVSLVPTSVDTVLPDYIQTQMFEPLLDGMLGRLMNYKNKPYSNADGAKYHLTRFRSGMARVRGNAIHGLNQSENTWNFPQGFANGRW